MLMTRVYFFAEPNGMHGLSAAVILFQAKKVRKTLLKFSKDKTESPGLRVKKRCTIQGFGIGGFLGSIKSYEPLCYLWLWFEIKVISLTSWKYADGLIHISISCIWTPLALSVFWLVLVS